MSTPPTVRARITRRTLLTLGAAALLPGCGTSTTRPDAEGSGQPDPTPTRTNAPSPTTSPRQHAAPASPVPDVCPRSADVLKKPGNPQQYLTCEGTNIALTIDDGPHPMWTPKVLALLARYDVRATFCVVGENVAAHPDLAARIIDGGHDIANHTFTHPMNLVSLTQAEISAEIERTSTTIAEATGGQTPRLFRAPGGTWSTQVVSLCAAAGMRPLDWSVDTRDWALPGVRHIVDTILTKTHPGAIILDHDGGGNRAQTVKALTIALPRLIDAGYQFTQP